MATNPSPQQPGQHPPEDSGPSRGPFGLPARWLIIGGGAGGIVLLIAIVVVAMASSGVFSGGNPQPKSALDLVPDDAEAVRRSNVREILAVDFLADELFPNGVFHAEHLGISDEDIDRLVTATWNSGAVDVIEGDFQLDDIRYELEDAGFEEDSYRGYEVWEFPQGGGMALLNGYIVAATSVGSVESVLKNLYNGSGSLARADDDNDMKRLFDELDDGFQVQAQLGSLCQVERCQGYVFALTEADESAERVTVRFALLFGNERAAERAADDYDEVADFLERAQGIDIEDTEADGDLVVGRAVEELGDDNSRSSNGGGRSDQRVQASASSQRDRWIADCDSLDLSIDHERGINHLAELEFIVVAGENQCECVYDYLELQYDPLQPPPLSAVHDISLEVGLTVPRYNAAVVSLRDASDVRSRDIPYYGHVDDLLDASRLCAGR